MEELPSVNSENEMKEEDFFENPSLFRYVTLAQAKEICHTLIGREVRTGRMKKPLCCEWCGSETPKNRLGGHHPNYGKPFDVIWLCKSCHAMVHNHLENFERTFRFWKNYEQMPELIKSARVKDPAFADFLADLYDDTTEWINAQPEYQI